MALIKKGYISEFGVPEEYWKITAVNFNYLLDYGDITLGGYMTKEARDAEYEPLSTYKIRCRWTDEEFQAYFSAEALRDKDFFDRMYEYVKQDSFFKDAING
ncbi:hypothetical protein UT300009_29730 [Paraclostridium bifermentans]